MRHVFGVAFARVEMDSSAQQELELSFLRISYAILRAREDGDEAQGYLAVVRQEARDALRRLKSVYGVGDELTIVFASLLVSDLAMLADAAERVRTGEDEDAERKVAGHIAAGALRREISEKEPGAAEIRDIRAMPLGVPWDFYGVVRAMPRETDAQTMCPRLL